MGKLGLEILIVLLLLVANGVFAMAEIAIIAARKARLQRLATAGDRRARAALRLASSPNQFLATVQVGISLVGILAGVFAGATIAEEVATFLEAVPQLAPYKDTIAVSIVVLGIAYFSLVLGELVPKRLALDNPERIASAIAAPMQTLSRIATPAVRLLSASTDLVIRVIGIKPPTEPAITSDEFKILIQQGGETGAIEVTEQDMLKGVLQLDERRVGAFMTPRTHVVSLDASDTPPRIRHKVTTSQQAHFPVVQGNLDNLLGSVRSQDLLVQSLAGEPMDLMALLRPPLYVPEAISALNLLELFKREGEEIAFVTDEYGGIEGVVTHKDVLEGIAGAIPSSASIPDPTATRRPDGSWLLDGLLHVDDLKEIFGLHTLPGESGSLYQTVGGFVMTHLQTVPLVGQTFEWRGLRFEVVDMDAHRVDKVLVTPLARPPGETE